MGAQEAQKMRDKGASRLTGDEGDVFVGAARIPEEEATVSLGLQKRLLGMVDITVDGLRPVRPL